ncbi:MAG TPA: extracellular solute-binding protein [Candidatus Acidoferrales bacterium]|nr:extracellular solute-binding protein [Candidatus Acidoferrales bacterium]
MTLLVFLFLWLSPAGAATGLSAESGKKAAAAQGFIFEESRDAIVAEARREGALRILYSFEPETMKAFKEGFAKKYPFIALEMEEVAGPDSAQRFLMEMRAGRAAHWDVVHLSSEFYNDYSAYLEKIDLLGMARAGVLQIQPPMIHPRHRNALAAATILGGIAYNKNLLPPHQVPKAWEDLLKPEYKGKKFLSELRSNTLAGLIPARGREWVLDYARKIAAQDPIWVRGATRFLAAVNAGEYALHSAAYYHTVIRLKQKGAENLEVVLPEPVPVRLNQPYGIVKGAKNRNAAMLFLEYICGAEGQRIIDDIEPQKSSIYFPGAKIAQLLRGKKLSVADWEHFDKMGSYTEEIFRAFGMPQAKR